MKIRTDIEIQEKINDNILNKNKYVEWLCQNKTEKQMEKLLHNLEKMYKFAVQKKTTNHIQLINLWKDQVNTALKNYSNYKHLYTIIKKFNKKIKLIDKCGDIEFRMVEGSDEYIQLESFLAFAVLVGKK